MPFLRGPFFDGHPILGADPEADDLALLQFMLLFGEHQVRQIQQQVYDILVQEILVNVGRFAFDMGRVLASRR